MIFILTFVIKRLLNNGVLVLSTAFGLLGRRNHPSNSLAGGCKIWTLYLFTQELVDGMRD